MRVSASTLRPRYLPTIARKISPNPKLFPRMNFKAAFGRLQTFSGSLRDALLDICDRCVGLLCIAVGDEPARAFRNVATHQQHTEPEEAADPESEAPAEVLVRSGQDRGTRAKHWSPPPLQAKSCH